MTITIETSGIQEVEQLLKVLKSLNIKNISIKEASVKRKPIIAKGDKALNPRALFGIWQGQPRTVQPLGSATRTLLKGKKKVNGEYSLVFLVYNMRRAVSILGTQALLELIRAGFLYILAFGRCVECQGLRLEPENFSMVGRYRAARSIECAA